MKILDATLKKEELAALTRSELLKLAWAEHQLLEQLHLELLGYKSENESLRAQTEGMNDLLDKLKRRLFGSLSEKPPTPAQGNEKKSRKLNPKRTDVASKLPSERYPHAAIVNIFPGSGEVEPCSCCGEPMHGLGKFDVSEQISSKPREIFILRYHRERRACTQCAGSLSLAPLPPRILPGSSYSDEFIIDVALSKYCDLIPVERFCAMAGRQGFSGLPPNSLHELLHNLARFLLCFVHLIADRILKARVLSADETPHRMLEGDERVNWYLWGFSDGENVAFEIQPTRSGTVASEILKHSECEVLVSDVYSGYSKAVRLVNEHRCMATSNTKSRAKVLMNSYCNAHSRRKFFEAAKNFPKEAEFYLNTYRKIYKIEGQVRSAPDFATKAALRMSMHPLFKDMQYQAELDQSKASKHSALGKAISYFLCHFENFIIPVWDPEVELDNNRQERALRNPVVGRKTWYGTHSKQGAQTAAIMMTLVESCKASGVNPREFFPAAVQALHNGDPPFTPAQFKAAKSNRLALN